jgi:hypothetical protein
LIIDLDVRNGCLQGCGPVDQSGGTINQVSFEKLGKSNCDRLAQLFIHGEDFSVPVKTGADSSELVLDSVSISLLEFPNFLQKLLSTQIMSSLVLLLHQFFLNNSLRGNTRMIGSRQIQSLVPLHSLSSDDRILNGNSQGMTNVQISSDVWWWQSDCELFGVCCLVISVEELVLVPPLVPVLLDGDWVVGVRHFGGVGFLSDGFIQGQFLGLLLFLKHVRSLFFCFGEFRGISIDQEFEHFVLFEHMIYVDFFYK